MRTYFTMLLVASVVSFLMTPLAQRVAFRIGAVDRPDPRKIHRAPTARLGGLAVVLGFCAPWVVLYFLDNQVARMFQQEQARALTLIGCGLVMFAVGVIDDIVGLSAMRKLVVQLAIAVAMFYGGFQIDRLSNPITNQALHLGWFGLPVTVIWIVGITNATNLLDGMDGLVSGVAAVMALSLALINILGNNALVALMTFSLAGAALGFLPYNFTPARIFLGDSGSLFLGIMMAGISTLSLFKAATAAFLLVPFLLFAIPLFDTTQVVIGRLRRGQHPFSPDKTHVHHRLLDSGLDQRQAAILLYTVTLSLGVAAILVSLVVTSRAGAGTFISLILVVAAIGTAVALLLRRAHRADRDTDPPAPGAT